MTTEEGQCRNPRIDEEVQSEFLGTMPKVQEHEREDLAHADYVVSCPVDMHKSILKLMEISVQKEDGLPSGLDGKAGVSHVMGLNASGEFKEVPIAGRGVQKTHRPAKSDPTQPNLLG